MRPLDDARLLLPLQIFGSGHDMIRKIFLAKLAEPVDLRELVLDFFGKSG